jgi:hypothetical protein
MKKLEKWRDEAINAKQWWLNPFWKDNEFIKKGLIAKSDIDIVLIKLKDIFNEKWFKKQIENWINSIIKLLADTNVKNNIDKFYPVYKEQIDKMKKRLLKPSEIYNLYVYLVGYNKKWHPFLHNLLLHDSGLWSYQYVIKVGLALNSMKENGILTKNFIERLLNDTENFSNTIFEAEICYSLIKKGCNIKRDYPTKKGITNKSNIDLFVEKGTERLYIELKKLESSRTNKINSETSTNISLSCLNNNDFTKRYPDIFINLECKLLFEPKPNLNYDDICLELRQSIDKNIKEKKWGNHKINGIAEYTISQNAEDRNKITIYHDILQEKEVEKIIENGIDKASKQLPDDNAGILILNPEIPINLNPDNLKNYKNISAVILYYPLLLDWKYSIFIKIFYNPYAYFSVENSAIIQDIMETENVIKNDVNSFFNKTGNYRLAIEDI